MHRTGNGNVIARSEAHLQKARATWIEENRTVYTYCSEREWFVFIEDLGDLIATKEDGTELRIHATIKDQTKSGAYRVIHNCLLVGKENTWKHYKMAVRDRIEAEFNS